MRSTYALFITLMVCLFANSASANHILGGELLYSHLSGNTYQVTLNIFGECSGQSFSKLKNAHPHIIITNGSGAFTTLILSENTSLRKDISNVCPAYKDKTTCKSPTGNVPGVTLFVYTGQTQLPPSDSWQILFAGHMDNSGKSQTGLSDYIANVTNNTAYGVHMYLEATLNNLHAPNNAPEYSSDPAPYYCVNTPQQYNQGAIDKEGDDLRFQLVPPVDINGIETKYTAPYTATQPFAVNTPVAYDILSGQMSFTPVKSEVAVVVNKVTEYRDGEIVGSSMRMITFFMLGNCSNQAPFGDIDPASVQGGLLDKNSVNLCDTAQKVVFRIPVTDVNNDNIDVTLNNIPPGANVVVQNNGTSSPVINFSWDMHQAHPGIYTFYAQYNDGACPMPGNQVMAYSINLAQPLSIFHEVLEPTNCIHKQFIKFHASGGILPRKIEVTDDKGQLINTYSDNNNGIQDSFAIGKYHVLLYSEHLPCSTQYDFEVTDYGTYPNPPGIEDIDQCLHQQPLIIYARPAKDGVVTWYDMQGHKLEQPPSYQTDSLAEYHWVVNQMVKVCPSVFDTMDVYIHPYPDINITTTGGHACIGDGIYLTATGGVRYDWTPANKITYYDDKPFTYVYEPETFIVTGYSEYNCSTKDTLVFDNIEQCCTFSYPNAFTPNQDGLNDGWKPITYGNMDSYQLSLYDRWGEKVFTTSDPKAKWDGSYLGKPCEMGTYNYLLKAKCVTGKNEESSGSFILLR